MGRLVCFKAEARWPALRVRASGPRDAQSVLSSTRIEGKDFR